MSAVMSKALRREVLARADVKRDQTVASVKKMLEKHAMKAAQHRNRRQAVAALSAAKIEKKVIEQLAF